MNTSHRMLLAALAAAGCAAEEAPRENAPPTTSVSITLSAQPELVAYRDDSSTTWTSEDVKDTRRFTLSVGGPYRLVVVCRLADNLIGVTEYARTIDDDNVVDACRGSAGDLTVRGKVAEVGAVALGHASAVGQTAPWEFALPARAGTYDLALLLGPSGAPDRIALRRDLEVKADVTLPTLDAASAHAEALVPTSYTPSNLAAGEQLAHRTVLHTPTLDIDVRAALVPATATAWATALVPASLLRPSDHQMVQLTAEHAAADVPHRTLSRTTAREAHAGDAATVTLPAPLTAVDFAVDGDQLTTSVTGLPAGAEIVLWRESDPGDTTGRVYQETRLSPRYVAATHPSTAVVDVSEVPDFKPSWAIDQTGHLLRGLSAIQRTSAYDYTSASVRDEVVPAGAR